MWEHSRAAFTRLGFLAITALLVGYILMSPPKAKAQEISNTSPICADILMVFGRGSGQNKAHEFINEPFSEFFQKKESESASFFGWFKTHLDVEYPNITYKAVSVHDFPGKYDPVGYKAVGIGFPLNADNTANAEASWIPGDYRQSVDHGVAETAGYLRDQISSCPDQSIAVGGYSQGAQVMGDSLFQLTPVEQSKIVGVGFFGDPKFIASSDSVLNPFDKAVSYPWRRGDATNKDRGMLDPRLPYVPTSLEKRTASHCLRIDIICSGWSGARPDSRVAHGTYAAEPMRNTVNEIMQWAAPQLAAAERARGGLGGSDPATPTPAQLTKARDIMFLLNDDSGDTVLQTLRYNLDPVLWPITQQYASTQYGVKGYGEGEQSGQPLPRVNNIQALLPYVGYDPSKPTTSSSNIARAITTRYPFAQPQMGGGDYADPHGLAVEKSVFSGGWRADAEKHLVLITDRPAKQNYSYNICNATVRSWLQIPNINGYEACYTKFGTDEWPKAQHPEVCETVYLAITQETCTNPLKTPGYTQSNNRTLSDGIMAAQSQGIAVDVVVPYKITDPYNQFGVDKMMTDLKYLAGSTGGKFIYYDQRTQYDQIMLSDTLRQIFGHTPTTLALAHKESLDGQPDFNKGNLVAETNQPVVMDVSQSSTHFDQYKWDFNNDGAWDQTTDGPVAETKFTTPQTGFARVLGVNTDGQSAETRVAVAVTPPTIQQTLLQLPNVPNLTATTGDDGKITITWQTEDPGDIVFVDPTSNLPVAMGSLSTQQLTFAPESAYAQLYAFVVHEGVLSERATIQVSPYVAPAPDPIPPPAPDPKPTPTPVPEGDGDPEVVEPPLDGPLVVEEPAPAEEPPVITDPELPNPAKETEPPAQEIPASVAELDPTLCYKLQTCPNGSIPALEIYQNTRSTTEGLEVGQPVTLPQQIRTSYGAQQPKVAAATDTRIANTPQRLSDEQPSSGDTTKAAANKWLLYILIILLCVVGLLLRRSRKSKG